MRNLQANIPDEQKCPRCKNPQQNIISKTKFNNTLKDHTTRLSGIYSWEAKIVKHMQINNYMPQ